MLCVLQTTQHMLMHALCFHSWANVDVWTRMCAHVARSFKAACMDVMPGSTQICIDGIALRDPRLCIAPGTSMHSSMHGCMHGSKTYLFCLLHCSMHSSAHFSACFHAGLQPGLCMLPCTAPCITLSRDLHRSTHGSMHGSANVSACLQARIHAGTQLVLLPRLARHTFTPVLIPILADTTVAPHCQRCQASVPACVHAASAAPMSQQWQRRRSLA